MAAAPQNATATFKLPDGRLVQVDQYLSDVAGAFCTFNPNGAAGTTSLQYWVAPADVVLVDFSIATGMTDTTNIVWTESGAIKPGTVLRYANQLNTIQTRPPLTIRFSKGALIGATQNA